MKKTACDNGAVLKPGPELLEDWMRLESEAAEPAPAASPCWLPPAVVNLPSILLLRSAACARGAGKGGSEILS